MPSSYSWPLSSPPSPSPVPSEGESAASLLSGTGGRLRRGIIIPFRRGSSDYVTAEGLALISSDIQQVLGTRCSSATTQGELLWRTDFGSLIEHARHRNNDDLLLALIRQWSVDAIARWLRNIRVTDVELERKKNDRGEETIASARIYWEVVAGGGDRIIGAGSSSVPLPSIGRP